MTDEPNDRFVDEQRRSVYPLVSEVRELARLGQPAIKKGGKPMRFIPVAITLSLLTACGGGGGGTNNLADATDPELTRLKGIVERADSLLVPSIHVRLTATILDVPVSESQTLALSCDGASCVGEDGEEADLLGEVTDTVFEAASATIGTRSGFDTATFGDRIEASERDLPLDALDIDDEDVDFSINLNADAYGLWGEHGAAVVALFTGPFSVQVEGESASGEIAAATAFAFGNDSATNPSGLGSATWEGIAEGASTRTYERRPGTATVTIADLSRPRVGIAVSLAGHSIAPESWADMPLAAGRYGTGAVGRDFVSGKFHGASHEETYGVFDTGAWVGAFGAKRREP